MRLAIAVPAEASSMLPGTVGPADEGTAGAMVAESRSASGAQFSNPAGLARFDRSAITLGAGMAYGTGSVHADDPSGYDPDNEVLAVIPDMAAVIARGRWTLAISSHGIAGARYDYGPDPQNGIVSGFYASTSIFAVPVGFSYRWSERLWLGAELIPMYAHSHNRFTTPIAEFGGAPATLHPTYSGFGVQAMLGVTWRPTPQWSLGLSGRPPGRIWMDGNTKLPSGSRQDVDLELEMPSEVSLGILRRFGDLAVSAAVRWTDSSALGTSYVRFEETPSVDSPFVADAKDEWRYSLGGEYRLDEAWLLRAGVAHASHIVGNRGVSPMSFDVPDTRVAIGAAYESARWTVDGAFVYLFAGDRRVDADDALMLPGRYESGAAYLLMVSVTRRF